MASSGSAQTLYSTDFIVQFLDRLGRPATTAEIRAALSENRIEIKNNSLNWALTNLNTSGRIRRVARGIYEAASPQGLNAHAELTNISTVQELGDWLDGKPAVFAQVIAARFALRVMPLATTVLKLQDIAYLERLIVIQSAFRSSFVSWAARRYFAPNIRRLAEQAGAAVALYARETADAALDAIAHSVMASGSEDDAIESATSGSAYAVYAAEAADAVDAAIDMWRSIDSDAKWLVANGPVEDAPQISARLASRPLWLDDVRGNVKYNVNFPPWARAEWDAFKRTPDLKQIGFDLWIRWYEARLVGAGASGFNPLLKGEANDRLDVRVATQPNVFWDRPPSIVNGEIRSWFYDVAPEPSPGPGPQYLLRNGRLSEEPSWPTEEEVAHQSNLHGRLRMDASKLADSLQRVANRYPELASAAQEYVELLKREIDQIDVTGVWCVGGAIAAFGRSYSEQNVARTLAEPLEPQLEAQLQSVIRQHGAFVMGFEEARALVQRADEFAVDVTRLREINEPGTILLRELTENRDLVDERTHALHKPVRDSVIEFGWAGSRVGYSAYLIVRNGVRAMIKFSVGDSPNTGAILGLLTGGSVMAGDPNAEFIRAAVPVLQQHGSQLLAFFNHSPEMRAYVEWALRILDVDRRSNKS